MIFPSARTGLVALVVLMLAAGCHRQDGSRAGQLQVAGIILQEDQFFRMVQLGMQDAARRMDVKLFLGNSQGSVDKEISLVDTYAVRGVGAIVVSPLSEKASVSALQRAHEKGITIVAYNTNLDADFPVSYIESNQLELGQTTGRAARKYIQEKLGGKAKLALIGFASQQPESGSARLKGFQDEVTQLPGVQIVARQDAWQAAEAANVISNILGAHPDLDIVWSANEGGTVGAVTAVTSSGRTGRVVVFGTDMSRQLADFLLADDNVLQAVTGQKPFEIGAKAIETAVDALRGKSVVPKVSFPGVLFSRAQPEQVKQYRQQLESLSP